MIRVGRLRRTVANAVRRECADIYISDNYVKHIAIHHKKELMQLGIEALAYVRIIVSNFNQIRKGTGNSLLLIMCSDEMSHIAAIEMNYSTKDGFWEVKTAQPRLKTKVEKKELLWGIAQVPKRSCNASHFLSKTKKAGSK